MEITSNTYLSSSLGGFKGQATDIEIHAKRILVTKKQLTSFLAYFAAQNEDSLIGRLSTPQERVNRLAVDCERDNFMTAEEAKSYGLISEVLYSPKHKKAYDEMNGLGYI